jgi:DnaB-like helicase N terminal domain
MDISEIKLPPCNLPAEQYLLAACLRYPTAREWAEENLNEADFADPLHGLIFKTLMKARNPRALNLDALGGADSYIGWLMHAHRTDAWEWLLCIESIVDTAKEREAFDAI